MQTSARLLLVSVFCGLALNAQQLTTCLWKGSLHDQKGGPIHGADIHLIGGHGELVARTLADGSFQFPHPAPGSYQLVVVVIAGVGHNATAPIDLTSDSPPAIVTIDQQGAVTVTFQPRPRKHT